VTTCDVQVIGAGIAAGMAGESGTAKE